MGATIRRFVLIGAAALALAACNKGGGGAQAPVGDEMSMGDANAKVTLVEYASVACPVCAAFNNTVFPEFKKKYVDTGKVRYVMREALTGNPTLAASGFLLARCAGKDKYFQVTDAIYRAQDQIYEPGSETVSPSAGKDVLLGIARNAGVSEDQYAKCTSDSDAITALNDRIQKSMQRDGVNGTPTFILNGKTVKVGFMSMAELDAALQPLVK
jgi:protein-disulfide isomerase